MAKILKSDIIKVGRNTVKPDHSYTDENVKWYNRSENSLVVFIKKKKKETCSYHTKQQLHSWGLIIEIGQFMFIKNLYMDTDSSYVHNSLNELGNNTKVIQWVNG